MTWITLLTNWNKHYDSIPWFSHATIDYNKNLFYSMHKYIFTAQHSSELVAGLHKLNSCCINNSLFSY